MKLRLNERQYNLLVEAESTHYGVNKLFKLANPNEFIILNQNADLDMSGTIDLTSQDVGSKYKIVRKDDSKFKMSLQQVDTDKTFVVDFKDFDRGILNSGKKFKINNIKLFRGGKPDVIVKPKMHSPNYMNNKNEKNEERVLNDFIKSMIGRKGDKLILNGDTDYEFKSLGNNDQYIKLKPISSEIKADGNIIIPIDSITHNGDNTFTMKYEVGGKSYPLKNIRSAKISEVKSSDEFIAIKEKLMSAKKGDTVKIGKLTFSVTKTGNPLGLEIIDDETQNIFSTIYKSNLKEEESEEYFQISLWSNDIEEESGQAVFSFDFVNKNDEGSYDKNKQTISDVRVDLDSISVSEDETPESGNDKKNSGKKVDATSDSESGYSPEDEKEILQMILKDKRFRNIIKKGIIPAEKIVRNIMDKKRGKLDDGSSRWMKSFSQYDTLSFIPDDSVGIQHKTSRGDGYLHFVKGKNYQVTVGRKDKDKRSIELKGNKDKLNYKVVIKKSDGDYYSAVISTRNDEKMGGSDKQKINVKIIK